MNFRILDLFSGAGGLSYGLEQLDNFKSVLATDNDPDSLATFKQNFPHAKIVLGDITDTNVRETIIQVATNEKVNMIVGGPPCQGFSLKGKKLGIKDPRNFLFLEYFNIVKAIQPEVFIIENVKNLIMAENGYFKNEIIRLFSDIGYIVNCDVLNAMNYGVPQSRQRAIIIGSKSHSIPLPRPLPTKHTTVKEAISDLSYLESGEGNDISEYTNKPQSAYQRAMRKNSSSLRHHVATNHSVVAIDKLKLIPPEGDKTSLPLHLHGKQKFATTWARLQWDKVSPTIDTRFDTPSNGRNSHPYLHRAITPREAARIQSFSDNFIFTGKKVSVCRQIGNAVPPLLATAIAHAINDSYQSTPAHSNGSTLYTADALMIVKEFINKGLQVDHIITDPPYAISKDNNFNTMQNPRKGVNFGEWDLKFDYLTWVDAYSKILAKNGSFIVFCSYRYISFIIDRLEKNGLAVKDVLVWKKSNPMPRNINRRYVQDMEFAVWAVKEKAKWVFNKPSNESYLRSLIETPTVAGKERTTHPTQKSLQLMERIVQIHTNQGQIILDPFMGSGTTGVAAIKLNRKFIGIELDKDYFKLAQNRINNLK